MKQLQTIVCTVLLLLLLLPAKLLAQYLYSEREINIPGQEVQIADQLVTFDGGRVIAATSHYPSSWTNHVNVIKLDSAGNLQWNKYYNVDCNMRDVIQCPDGGIILSGEDNYNANSYQVLKLDQSGALLYDKRVDVAGHGTLAAPVMKARNNDHVFFAATVVDTATYHWHTHLFELDEMGNPVFSFILHADTMFYEVADIDTFSNGDILLLGSRYTTTISKFYPVVDRISRSGNLLWSKRYFAATLDLHAFCIEPAGNDNFFIETSLIQPGSFGNIGGFTLIKLDPSGNALSSRKYNDQIVQAGDMLFNTAGELCITGSNAFDSYFIRVDTSSGSLISTRNYPRREFFTLDTLPGGNFTIGGINVTNWKIVSVITSPSGESCNDSIYPFTTALFSMIIYPDSVIYPAAISTSDESYEMNLSITTSVVCSTVDIEESIGDEPIFETRFEGSQLFLHSDRAIEFIHIYDASGKCVIASDVHSQSASLDMSWALPGMYLIEAGINGTSVVQKILKTQ